MGKLKGLNFKGAEEGVRWYCAVVVVMIANAITGRTVVDLLGKTYVISACRVKRIR